MLFTELIHAIYPHLAGERNTAASMRDMLERLSSVPEELRLTTRGKPPSEDRANSTLRKWYTRGLPKTLTRQMLKNPRRETFVDSLNYANNIETESADEVKTALVDCIVSFTEKDVDEDNVGDVIFDLVQQSLEFIVKSELENDRKIQQAAIASDQAKGSFVSRLLEECKHMCSRPGCGQHLQPPSGNNIAAPNYGLARITGDARDYPNLIALCPSYFHSYSLGHPKTEEVELSRIKQIQVRSAESRQDLSTVDIERDITKVVKKIGNANFKDFEQLNYDPVAVKDKIDEQGHYFLYVEVMTHFTRYFRFNEKQMQEETQLKTYDDDLLRAQIKTLSHKLVEKGYSPSGVHNDLTEQLSQITKQDHRYCAFVVSYFVQSSEVLDASA